MFHVQDVQAIGVKRRVTKLRTFNADPNIPRKLPAKHRFLTHASWKIRKNRTVIKRLSQSAIPIPLFVFYSL